MSNNSNNRNRNNKDNIHINEIDQPLSIEYADQKKIFLEEGIAYQIAKEMGDIPSHQLRKILEPLKAAVMKIKRSEHHPEETKENKDALEEARNMLYHLVPLTAYNAGRNKDIKLLYRFVKAHINEKSIVTRDDIYTLDKLFTSIIAYHKFFKKR